MSGTEIMDVIEKETKGRWKPSPGSVYPHLAWLQEVGYTKEMPAEEAGTKRYILTKQGEKFFEEQTKLKEKLDSKLEFLAPLLFWPEKLRELREPAGRLFRALLNLRALEKNLTDQDLKVMVHILNNTAEKIEEMSSILKEERKND